jgi:transposase
MGPRWAVEKKGGTQEPADHAWGRSRGGWGTTIQVVADGPGTPLTVGITPGQAHASTAVTATLQAVRIPQPLGQPRGRPACVTGDKGYDIPRVRRWLRRRGIRAVIPEKSKPYGRGPGRPPRFDAPTYRRRNVIERCIGWLKHARRMATRYEKTAVNFLAMLKLVMIQHYFKTHLRDTT